jgi:hypothetical protein
MTWDLEQAIVSAGFRVLAKQSHPDKGGTTAQMTALNAARERLKALIGYAQQSFDAQTQAVPHYNDGRAVAVPTHPAPPQTIADFITFFREHAPDPVTASIFDLVREFAKDFTRAQTKPKAVHPARRKRQ